jgi:hypothetical protein
MNEGKVKEKGRVNQSRGSWRTGDADALAACGHVEDVVVRRQGKHLAVDLDVEVRQRRHLAAVHGGLAIRRWNQRAD